MITAVRFLVLFLLVWDWTDDWLVAAVVPEPSAEVLPASQSFAPIALRYRAEIIQKIQKPFEVAAAVVTPVAFLPAPSLLYELQAMSLPPLPSADPLYVFMSLQR